MGSLGLLALLVLPLFPAQAQAPPDKREILPLGEQDQRKLEKQRSVVMKLSRRHVGSPIRGGSMDDLRVLQELLDRRVVGRNQVYELQAMGVALGDVMANNLGLHWVVVDDRYGRSRALASGEGEDVVFPITMISKRVAAGIPVEIHKLYESIASSFAASP
jgi:hypothetical protein